MNGGEFSNTYRAQYSLILAVICSKARYYKKILLSIYVLIKYFHKNVARTNAKIRMGIPDLIYSYIKSFNNHLYSFYIY